MNWARKPSDFLIDKLSVTATDNDINVYLAANNLDIPLFNLQRLENDEKY